MAYAKIELFETELQECAELFKAMAHPARLAILKYLTETKTCITGDFVDELPLSRTTVNQHLAELKEAGFIKCHTEGTKTFYCLNLKELQSFKKIADRLLSELCDPNNCCK